MAISQDNKLFFKNFSYLTLVQIGNVLIPLLVIPFIARNILVESFGALEFSRYFCYFFSLLILYSFDITTTREIIKNRNDSRQLNYILMQNLYARIFLFVISTLILVPLVEFVPAFAEYRSLIYLTYLINLGFVMLPMFFFQGMESLGKISIITLFVRAITGLLIILIITEDSLYWVYNFMQSVAYIAIAVLGLWLIFRSYKFRLLPVDTFYIRQLLKNGTPVFLTGLVLFLFSSFYFYFLQLYSNETELGVFSTANKIIVSVNSLMLLPFSQAFFPMINKTFFEKPEQFLGTLKKALLLICASGLIGGLALVWLARIIIQIAFGANYLDSVSSLQIMGFVPLFALLNNLVGYQILLTLKKDRLFFALNAVLCLITLLVCYALRDEMSSIFASSIRLISEMLLFLVMGTVAFFFIKKQKHHA